MLNQLPEDKKPDYYVSATNDFTIEAALTYDDKMMIPYHRYIHDKNKLRDRKVMVYLAPILRKTEEELDNAVNTLANRLASSNPEAMSELKKIFWKGTENWDTLLVERAGISGRLVLSEFTRNAIQKFKAKA